MKSRLTRPSDDHRRLLEVMRRAAPTVKGARAMRQQRKGVGAIEDDELEYAGQDSCDRRTNKRRER